MGERHLGFAWSLAILSCQRTAGQRFEHLTAKRDWHEPQKCFEANDFVPAGPLNALRQRGERLAFGLRIAYWFGGADLDCRARTSKWFWFNGLPGESLFSQIVTGFWGTADPDSECRAAVARANQKPRCERSCFRPYSLETPRKSCRPIGPALAGVLRRAGFEMGDPGAS